MAARFFLKVISPSKHNCYTACLRRNIAKIYLRRYSASFFASQGLKNLASEAEKVVGYPTSLIRYLLTDEISSVLVQSKKLVGSRHPLVKTARQLVYDGTEGFEAIGLIVLLMSRTGESLMTSSPPLGHEAVTGVLRNQRKLAEVAETINAGYMVHLGVMNKNDFQPSDDAKIMNFGNKISILSGDFLLAKASVGLGELENSEVVEIMAEVIGDIVEGEMLKENIKFENLAWNDWEHIVFKSRGSLLAKSCLSVLKLGSLSKMHQDAGFSFGKNLAFLQQLHSDYLELSCDLGTIPVTNAAIILAKDELRSNVAETELKETYLMLNETTRNVIEDSDFYSKMQTNCDIYGGKALESLGHFPTSEAKNCLENLVKHLHVLGENK